MSKRWLMILLFVSVAFNVAVLGGFLYMRYTRAHLLRGMGPGWHHRAEHRDRPSWHPGARAMFDDSTRVLRTQFENTKMELMRELAKETMDMPKINSIIEQSLNAQTSLEQHLGQRLIRFRQSLKPDEAKEHFELRIKEMERRHKERNNPNSRYNKHRRRQK